ncbi:hypothetical protein B0H17DRAFT_1214681 [Mycena rosella]|uniref:Uncharacterized protein n=1 Tax=Mycena rosella TaxID=1033263 RepID=A0AAD7G0K4_MYCRO|nr:hypothetical protein B0H17DRAFT_1214681 [Mycena rosella]
MARTKTTNESQTKTTKTMYKLYDETAVPDIMPFPALSHVAITKGEEAAVPKLNEHQRSWIHGIGLHGVDLVALTRKAADDFYDRVKNDAFAAKAFQHQVQPEDREEEASLIGLVAAWKLANPQKKKKRRTTTDDDDDGSDQEEDEGGHAGLLRGYSKAGWRIVIQRVISNKRSARVLKHKPKQEAASKLIPEPTALAKLLGLTVYTGRDKFRDDRHDIIYEHSKTLMDVPNPVGRVRRAEALMWANEDQAWWEAAAGAEEGVDWVERQRLVPSGFKHMVDALHTSGKFRPFVNDEGEVHFEWAEAVPKDICLCHAFEKQYVQLVKENVNAMYAWAEKPLQEYAAARGDSIKAPAPVFDLSAEELDDVSPNVLTQKVTGFLAESYKAVFGSGDIPWAAIVSAPDAYYDTTLVPLGFTLEGVDALSDVGLLPQASLERRVSRSLAPWITGLLAPWITGLLAPWITRSLAPRVTRSRITLSFAIGSSRHNAPCDTDPLAPRDTPSLAVASSRHHAPHDTDPLAPRDTPSLAVASSRHHAPRDTDPLAPRDAPSLASYGRHPTPSARRPGGSSGARRS